MARQRLQYVPCLINLYVCVTPTEEKRFELLRVLPAQLATETASP